MAEEAERRDGIPTPSPHMAVPTAHARPPRYAANAHRKSSQIGKRTSHSSSSLVRTHSRIHSLSLTRSLARIDKDVRQLVSATRHLPPN